MHILITGGAGFIGSHTTELLLQAGHQVRVLDNFSSGKRDNLAVVAGQVEIFEQDIRSYPDLLAACRGIDVVLHLAAISSVEKSLHEPLESHEVNATGSFNVIEAARQAGVQRVVMASSAAVYGDEPGLPKTEASPIQPLSPYAWQKLTGEFYGRTYQSMHGLEFLALRYFNVYGPRQDPGSPYSGVLSLFVDRSLRGEPLIVHGDGQQTRDFIHVSDVAQVNVLAVATPAPVLDIINVATGQETKIIEVAKVIQSLSGSIAAIDFGPARPGDVLRSFADNSSLVETVGHLPRMGMKDGLQGLLEYRKVELAGMEVG